MQSGYYDGQGLALSGINDAAKAENLTPLLLQSNLTTFALIFSRIIALYCHVFFHTDICVADAYQCPSRVRRSSVSEQSHWQSMRSLKSFKESHVLASGVDDIKA